MTWENVAVMAGVTFVSAAAVFLLSKPIGAYQMGRRMRKAWESMSHICVSLW